MKKLSLSTRVFIGFGLGILLGVIFGEKVLVIKIIGDIFLKLIKMLTVPLVFFSIISGITNLTDVNKLKRVGAKILGMYVVTTLLAGFIGLGIAHLINPGIGFQIDSSAIGSYEATAMNSISDTLLAMVPDNIINAMANTNMMGIIIFCAIFGCAMVMLGSKVSVVKDFIVQTTDIMYKMTAIIMETSPFGVCALMACAIGQYGPKIFGPLGKFILCDYLNCAVIVFVMYFLILKFMGKVKFPYFMRKILPLWAMTAATTSSSGSLPVTMRITRDDFKVEEELYGFSLPLGATINMDGTSIMQGVAVVFAAQAFGIHLSMADYITVIGTATLASVGTAGVPSVGLVTLTMVFNSVGLPVEAIGLIMGIDRILDMTRTAVNITGDAVCTTIVAHQNKALDKNVFYAEEN